MVIFLWPKCLNMPFYSLCKTFFYFEGGEELKHSISLLFSSKFKVHVQNSCLTFWKCLAIYDNIHPNFLTWHSSFSLKKSSPGVFVFYLISFFHSNWTIFLLQNLLTNGCKIHDWYSKQYPTFQARNLEIKHNRSLY